MDPVRKHIHQSNVAPFHLAFQHTKSRAEELPHHVHEWHEILFIHKGTCTFFIDETFYDLEPGDTVIIPGNVIHCTQLEKEKTLTTSALFFSPLLLTSSYSAEQDLLSSLFLQSKDNKKYRYHLSDDKQQQLTNMFQNLNKETELSDLFSTEMTALLIRTMIIFISRHCQTPDDTEFSSPHIPTWIKDSIIYINEHLHEDLDLSMLAHTACVHPAYFSKRFKSAVGLNYSEFVKSKRMIRAKELLDTTEQSIQQVAENCGYASMPHFFRTFRSITGKTPSTYRKRTLK